MIIVCNGWIKCEYGRGKYNMDELKFVWAFRFLYDWYAIWHSFVITKFTFQFVKCEAIIWTLSSVYNDKVCEQ